MIQNSFIDMESMFKLFDEEEEVRSVQAFHTGRRAVVVYFYIFNVFVFTFMSSCSLRQVKDEVNAGNLLYRKGKIEFKNVYFSYTNGLV